MSSRDVQTRRLRLREDTLTSVRSLEPGVLSHVAYAHRGCRLERGNMPTTILDTFKESLSKLISNCDVRARRHIGEVDSAIS
jgi:hypothetical protein